MKGSMRLDRVTESDLKEVKEKARERAVVRRNSRLGIGAQENTVGAMRSVFRQAKQDGHIEVDPSAGVPKPRRNPSVRRALSTEELRQIWEVVSSGGDDPLLDALLVRFFVETGARRDGALALRLQDFLIDTQEIRLREKGGTERWQPISKSLLDALLAHATERGATDDDDQVFRHLPRKGTTVGQRITRRRFNTLTNRIQKALPWARKYGVSPHWLRHTAITSVERVAGFAVARAFAGHSVDVQTTNTYVKADNVEVARAVSILTGEEHPLARCASRQTTSSRQDGR
jgi:integrase/recombinase XerC